MDHYWKSNNYGDNRGIKHLAFDSSKGACYYVSKYYDRNVDNDIFVKTNFNTIKKLLLILLCLPIILLGAKKP